MCLYPALSGTCLSALQMLPGPWSYLKAGQNSTQSSLWVEIRTGVLENVATADLLQTTFSNIDSYFVQLESTLTACNKFHEWERS